MDTRILKLMDDIYNENGCQPMLLARFGELLHERIETTEFAPPLEKRIGKLVDASGKYKRVQPYPKAAWWVCLADQEVDTSNALPNIRNSLLLAFLKELPDGMTRYYHKTPPYGFNDYESEPTTPDYIKMDASDLRPSPSILLKDLPAQKRKELSAHAVAWAETHGLSHDVIYITKRETPPPTSLLNRLINALVEEDRKRISLPLDIIAELAHAK